MDSKVLLIFCAVLTSMHHTRVVAGSNFFTKKYWTNSTEYILEKLEWDIHFCSLTTFLLPNKEPGKQRKEILLDLYF